jgi:fucose 4-O-acetylase-like acetyltransferase
MAILTLLLPPIFRRQQNSYSKTLVFSFSIIVVIQILFPDIQGTGVWADRVDDGSIQTIVSNLILTGTYPLFPWFFFALFGATISAQSVKDGKSLEMSPLVRLGLILGLLYCLTTLVYAQLNNILWAHPTEDAVLTFFPANQSFLIAGSTGVVLLWILVQRYSMNLLSYTGRLSLSIYLIHFIPLTLMRDFEVTHQWGLQTSTLAVLVYTLIWIPTAVVWQRYWPKASVETLLRAVRKSLF